MILFQKPQKNSNNNKETNKKKIYERNENFLHTFKKNYFFLQ